jgi:metal-dependent hydrolase (beta-lactamase superfamily II)
MFDESRTIGLETTSGLTTKRLSRNPSNVDENFHVAGPYDPLRYDEHSSHDEAPQRKDNLMRDRDFVVRVENINKIHDKINEMLSFVKKGGETTQPLNKYPKWTPQQRCTAQNSETEMRVRPNKKVNEVYN